jgi:hypothetical protein
MAKVATGVTKPICAGPFIEKPPGILNQPDGSVLLECLVQAKPQPDVKWFHGETELKNDDRHAMKTKKMVGKFNVTLNIKVCEHNSDKNMLNHHRGWFPRFISKLHLHLLLHYSL